MSEEQLAGRARELENEWNALHEQVIAAGGLHIVGTERHESRRIDNQLRGRSGRQGDPGSSRFYLSMEDNLMRIFGDPERTKRLLQTVGMKEGEAIESGMLTRQIERAQRKVESHNFDIRKNLLEYDDVANDQRKVVYRQRTEIMSDRRHRRRDPRRARRGHQQPRAPGTFRPTASRSNGTSPASNRRWSATSASAPASRPGSPRTRRARARMRPRATWRRSKPPTMPRRAQVGAAVMRHVERAVMLQQLDMHWREHLASMDYLRQGIYLRAYAQKNPKQEYKREAFALFTAMLDRIRADSVMLLQRLQVRSEEEIEREEAERQRRLQARMQLQHAAPPDLAAQASPSAGEPPPAGQPSEAAAAPFVRGERKVGRNEPCPCGSGRKFKHCHGALQPAGG